MQRNNEDKTTQERRVNYQIANRHTIYTTCRMLTALYDQAITYGTAVITDLASTVVNSTLAPPLARTLARQDYDPIEEAKIPNASTPEKQQSEVCRNSLTR